MPQVLFLLAITVLAFLLWRNWSRQRRASFIAHYPYQRLLDQRLAARHPELTHEQRTEIFTALRDYFQLCRHARRQLVAMPSQAVDDAWHEFILFTRAYDHFCRHAFGRFLHHTPAAAMATPTQASEGIKRAWQLACAHEGIDPKQPQRLPRLFALDAALGIAGGFVYQLDCLATQTRPDGSAFCASHIGCTGGSGCDDGSTDGDGCGDGGGCGGD